MKLLTTITILLGLAVTPALAQTAKTNAPVNVPAQIKASEAKQYVGGKTVVTGKIAEVNIAEKLVRLNMEKPFPDTPFTAVIFANKTNLFPDLDKLEGKSVEVSGTIGEYRNRPQIILTNAAQLKVLDKAPEAAGKEKK